MHDCQRFREDLTDHILGGSNPPVDEALGNELSSCESCSSFYSDAKAILKIIDSTSPQPPELSAAYWQDFSTRLRSDLKRERRWFLKPDMSWPMLAVAASLLLVFAFAGFRALRPHESKAPIATREAAVQAPDDAIWDLDPGTVDYLGQSELFLRTFVKLRLTDTEDLEDARARAERQLIALRQRKEAAAEFPPVEGVLDDYETVLRDINNLERPSAQDIAEIQHRIERNGLIATMKAYQPRLDITAEP